MKQRSNKWILFIAPPGKPKFDFLAAAGIEKSRIITLNETHVSKKNTLFSKKNYIIKFYLHIKVFMFVTMI